MSDEISKVNWSGLLDEHAYAVGAKLAHALHEEEKAARKIVDDMCNDIFKLLMRANRYPLVQNDGNKLVADLEALLAKYKNDGGDNE